MSDFLSLYDPQPVCVSNMISYLNDHAAISSSNGSDENYQANGFYSKTFEFDALAQPTTEIIANETEGEKNYLLNEKEKKYEKSLCLVLQIEEPLYIVEFWYGLVENLLNWVKCKTWSGLWVEIPVNFPEADSLLEKMLHPNANIKQMKVLINHPNPLTNTLNEYSDEANRNRSFESKRDSKLIQQIYQEFQKWCLDMEGEM